MIVVLPAPLGPIRPATVPAGTLNDTWSTAMRVPNRLRQPVDDDGVVVAIGRPADRDVGGV